MCHLKKYYFYRRDKFWRNIIVRNIFALSFILMVLQIFLNVFYDCRNRTQSNYLEMPKQLVPTLVIAPFDKGESTRIYIWDLPRGISAGRVSRDDVNCKPTRDK